MVFEKVVSIISEKMDIAPDSITPDADFETLKMDSLDMVEITMDVEEQFDIVIESASEDMKTVGDLVKYIEENKR